jgi:hypothetical protein
VGGHPAVGFEQVEYVIVRSPDVPVAPCAPIVSSQICSWKAPALHPGGGRPTAYQREAMAGTSRCSVHLGTTVPPGRVVS